MSVCCIQNDIWLPCSTLLSRTILFDVLMWLTISRASEKCLDLLHYLLLFRLAQVPIIVLLVDSRWVGRSATCKQWFDLEKVNKSLDHPNVWSTFRGQASGNDICASLHFSVRQFYHTWIWQRETDGTHSLQQPLLYRSEYIFRWDEMGHGALSSRGCSMQCHRYIITTKAQCIPAPHKMIRSIGLMTSKKAE
jgi:hypothetical protein